MALQPLDILAQELHRRRDPEVRRDQCYHNQGHHGYDAQQDRGWYRVEYTLEQILEVVQEVVQPTHGRPTGFFGLGVQRESERGVPIWTDGADPAG